MSLRLRRRPVTGQRQKSTCLTVNANGVEWLEDRRLLSVSGTDEHVLMRSPMLIVDPALPPAAAQASPLAAANAVPLTEIPQLNSLPNAHVKLYLNFVGNTTPEWGEFTPGTTPAYDTDGDATTFSDSELADIAEVWARVSEKFSPFPINVTTVDPGNRNDQETFEVVIGGDGAWLGPAGGVAFLGSFYNVAPNVGFAFPVMVGGTRQAIAEVIAHEAGHGFGLEHQSRWVNGEMVQEYNSGDSQRAPIMGNSYTTARGLWWNGATPASSTTLQDDLSVLSNSLNGFGYRTDDHGGSPQTATAVDLVNNQFSAKGIIANMADADYFQFTVVPGNLFLQVSQIDIGAMLDASLEVRNLNNEIIASMATSSLGESLSVTLGSGTYYAVVRSAGGYGDIGQYTVSALFEPQSIVALGPDVTKFEGDNGFTNFVFDVHYFQATDLPVAVSYSTFSDTATAGIDFVPASGLLLFTPGGPTSQSVTVQVVGDLLVEEHETFLLRLTSVLGGVAGRDEAVGTILNDDVELSISDVVIRETNSGTVNAVFTVSVFGARSETVTTSYATIDGTATAPGDYLPRSGAISLPPGTDFATITVPVVGDLVSESNETFSVMLLNSQHARVVKPFGVATIVDDDPLPSFYVNDVYVTTIYPGVLGAVFTVGLDTPSGQNVYVNYSTEDGLAKSGIDYQSAAGVLTFAPGARTQQVTVPVMTSDVYSPNEKFYLNLSSPVNALMTDSQGVCTIVFAPPPINESIRDDGGPGYSQTAGWTTVTNTLAYELDYSYAAAGSGNAAATWSFNSLPAGEYQVFARWVPFSNWASNAPYTILDGNTARGTVQVNQRVAPAGELSNGVVWQSLGTFQVNSHTLNVRLSNNANGYVVADAIRIVRGGIGQPAPEIDVAGTLHSIANGQSSTLLDNGTDFGSGAAQIDSLVRTFTITNTGNAELHLSGNPRVAISGAHAGDFTVLSQPAAVLAPGAASSFQVRFRPQAVGLRQATISIANNDSNESLYTFAIQGAGFAVGATQVTIDDSMAAFSQTGAWTNTANLQATGGQFRTSNPAQGAASATWTFFNLAPGSYDVYATWVPAGNLATNAPFGLADGNAPASTVLVNQQLQPSTPLNGKNWGQLGTIDVASGALRVTLGNNANGLVLADAVMVVRRENAPAPLAHNQAMPLDVNGDARVSAFDALLVINSLHAQSDSGQAAPLAASAAPSYFVDVNGDGRVSALDALMVINHLLNQPSAAPSAAPLASEEPSAPDLLPLAGLDQTLRADEETDEIQAPIAWLLPTEAGPIVANTAAANQVWEDVADESAADLADDDAWDSLLRVLGE